MKKSEAKQDKKTVLEWLKEHKKELAIAGMSIAGIILTILAIKNRDKLMKYLSELQDVISKLTKTEQSKKTMSICNTASTNIVSEIPEHIEISEAVTSDNPITHRIPFEVQKHIRNLPQGYHPSIAKIETALENGIELAPHQTWVRDYQKGLEAA